MINKTVISAIALFVGISFALMGCGNSGEETEAGIEKVKQAGQGQEAINVGAPSDGKSEPDAGLPMPPGKSGGK